MRIFAGEWVKNILTRLGMKEGEAIESRMVSQRIEGAQKKVEERNFDIRKNLLEYDEVMDEQRKRVYGYRQGILDGGNCKQLILEMINEPDRALIWARSSTGDMASTRSPPGPAACSASNSSRSEFAGSISPPPSSSPATRPSGWPKAQIFEAIEENLPEGEEEDEWNWEALAKFANTRWKTNFRDRDLKKVGRDGRRRAAHRAGPRGDRQGRPERRGQRFLAEDFGVRTRLRLGALQVRLRARPGGGRRLEPDGVQGTWSATRPPRPTTRRRPNIPVMAGLYHFAHPRRLRGRSATTARGWSAWARERFGVDLDVDDLKSKQRDEIRSVADREEPRQPAAGRSGARRIAPPRGRTARASGSRRPIPRAPDGRRRSHGRPRPRRWAAGRLAAARRLELRCRSTSSPGSSRDGVGEPRAR